MSLDEQIIRGRVARRLSAFPPSYRQTVCLYYTGYRLHEIAMVQGVTKRTVHWKTTRVLADVTKRPKIPPCVNKSCLDRFALVSYFG